MKKVISFTLFLLMLITMFTIASSAVSLSDGKKALEDTFLDGKCPGAGDYAYFAPEGAGKNNVKYPLVIFIHGQSSGDKPRKQVTSYNFTNYASEEFQSRFRDTNGAFIMLPRSQELEHSWTALSCETVKKQIDHLISQYPNNIDMSRIYIGGLSAGGSMVYFMLDAYPTFFAAAFPMCSIYQPYNFEMNSWKDISFWIHCSDNDYYLSANTASSLVAFRYITSISNRPESMRMTSYSKAIYADGHSATDSKREHYIWDAVCYDMHMADGSPYMYATTKNAFGDKISFDDTEGGFIDWLYQQKRPEEPKRPNLFQGILDYILNIFNYIRSIFGF